MIDRITFWECAFVASNLRLLCALALVPLLLVSAVACGGDDDDDSNGSGNNTPAGNGGGGGSGGNTWSGEFETGTEVSLELWVDASDPALADFESFREATGTPPVLYARATATNTGTEPDTSRFATLTGSDGNIFADDTVEVVFLCARLDNWMDNAGERTTALIQQWSDLIEGPCNGDILAGPRIDPGQTVTYFLVLEAETGPTFQRVFMGLGNELRR